MIQVTTRNRRAFTLTELLVAMAVIAVVGGITVVAVRGLTQGARTATAMNQITASLSNARAYAIKENRVVAVLFRARWDPAKPREAQRTEIVTASWTLETIVPVNNVFLDRFEPVPDIPPQTLPVGIKVAAPWYDASDDDVWIYTTDFPSIVAGEMTSTNGRLFAILYGPDGNVMTFNPRSGANQLYVDFWNADPAEPGQDYDWNDPMLAEFCDGTPDYWCYSHPQDESNVNPAPYLAVFDFQDAKERRTTDWTDGDNIEAELTGPDGYIARNGTLIQFNRYTGVIMSGGER